MKIDNKTHNKCDKKKIIFLDIDGVLQPGNNQKRFKHDLDKLQHKLSIEKDEKYRAMSKFDIGAVFYDWDTDAVKYLKTLCEKTGAGLVISSEWRTTKSLDTLKLLFRLHGLDGYIIDRTDELSGYERPQEIERYLVNHPGIEKFVILDDCYRSEFERFFPNQFVYCKYVFDNLCYQKALSIMR